MFAPPFFFFILPFCGGCGLDMSPAFSSILLWRFAARTLHRVHIDTIHPSPPSNSIHPTTTTPPASGMALHNSSFRFFIHHPSLSLALLLLLLLLPNTPNTPTTIIITTTINSIVFPQFGPTSHRSSWLSLFLYPFLSSSSSCFPINPPVPLLLGGAHSKACTGPVEACEP